jgi:hypothetical protein
MNTPTPNQAAQRAADEGSGNGAANSIFAEATTSTAFLLTLTKRQCNTLLRVAAHEAMNGDASGLMDGPAHISIVANDSVAGLRSRGLYTNRLTKAGRLMAELLAEAGLTIESTNTLMTIRRMQRQAEAA